MNHLIWECKECGFELVEVSKIVLHQINEILHSNIKTIPKNWKRSKSLKFKICPQCDAYALGIEMVKGFPVIDKFGNEITIHDLEFRLWK